jgi:ATP-binding cassette subfamily F protein uup
VVTHDRWFLDVVCTRTWEVAGGRVESYLGGYADWVFARAERARQADAAEARRQNLARKELAWLRRGPPARTSKPRFRIEAAEALIADVPPPRDKVELLGFATNRLGRTVLELEDATATIGGRALLDHVTWRLGPGDRVGIVGINGSGKTTLLHTLTGERPLDGGRLVRGTTVQLAELSQELVDLPREMRVLEATEAVAKYVRLGKLELTASSVLERLGFPAARQWTPVGQLSGGERRRLQLTRLLMAEPNVLLLDEPTNDLDVDTLSRLEDLLDGWPGTLVVVSHDRYLVERVCDTVVALLGDGKITHLPGGIEEYLRRRASATTGGQAQAGARGGGATQAPPRAGSASGGSTQAPRPGAEQRTARREAARLERRLETLAGQEKRLHEQMVEAATDPDRLLALDGELRAVVAERESVELEWLTAAEAAE